MSSAAGGRRGGAHGHETIKRVDDTPAAGGEKAIVIPFPMARRPGFVAKITAQVLARSAAAGEAHLSQQLRRQAQILARKGAPAALAALQNKPAFARKQYLRVQSWLDLGWDAETILWSAAREERKRSRPGRTLRYFEIELKKLYGPLMKQESAA